MSTLPDYVDALSTKLETIVAQQFGRVPIASLKAFAALMQKKQLDLSLAAPGIGEKEFVTLQAQWAVYQDLRLEMANEIERRNDLDKLKKEEVNG